MEEARKDSLLRTILLAVSVFTALFGSLVCYAGKIERGGHRLAFVVLGITTLTVIAETLLRQRIAKNRGKEYILRDEYNHRVLGVESNNLYGKESDRMFEELISPAYFQEGKPEQTQWFGTRLSGSEEASAMYFLMERPVYTSHAYRMLQDRILAGVILGLFLFFLYAVWYIAYAGDRDAMLAHPFVLLLSMAPWLNASVNDMVLAGTLRDTASGLVRYADSARDDFKEKEGMAPLTLRTASNVIFYSRPDGLFIPENIYRKCLKEGSEYRKDMDRIRKEYVGEDSEEPEGEEYRMGCI